MKNDIEYIKYLETTAQLQADFIQRLETLIIPERTYRNSIYGISLGETWLKKHKASIIVKIIKNGRTSKP